MQPDVIASRHSPIETPVAPLPNKSDAAESNRESLFEHVAWAYALCREADFHILIASRLFTILPEPNRVVAQMYRVLKPGGRCFIAEPRYAYWASIPLFAMWLLAGVTRFKNGYCEPRKAMVFSAQAFENLFPTQPWKQIKTWQDGRYQYAVCEKA